MAEVEVRFSGLSKRFGRRAVLRNVNGAARPGEVLVVTGPNGSGKSTLLNILGGLLRPSQGEVTYLSGGRVLPKEEWHRHLGVCAPDLSVYEELSAVENLRFFTQVRGLRLPEKELAAVLEQLGLKGSDFFRPVKQFSSGMLQRVKLAQALVHQPRVLLLDEPSSNLDEAGHRLLAGLVMAWRERATVVIATNDPREVAWGDKVLELAH